MSYLSRFGYSDEAKQPIAVVGKVTVLDDAGVGVGPIGRFAFDDVVHRLYRTPFVADLDLVTLRALSPLVVFEKSAVIGIAAIGSPLRLPLRIL